LIRLLDRYGKQIASVFTVFIIGQRPKVTLIRQFRISITMTCSNEMTLSSTNLGSFVHRIIAHFVVADDAYFGSLHV
jgi:hypothetical protein